MKDGRPSVAGLVSALGVATLLGLLPFSVNAEGLREAPVSSRTAGSGYSIEYSPARPFFVEFCARNAESYGHLYVMYGEANDRHEIVRSEIAGFFPRAIPSTATNAVSTGGQLGTFCQCRPKSAQATGISKSNTSLPVSDLDRPPAVSEPRYIHKTAAKLI